MRVCRYIENNRGIKIFEGEIIFLKGIQRYDDKKYKSYNDFFIRKVIAYKRPISASKFAFISPCDGKLTAYKIGDDLTLNIKNSYYSIDTLVDDKIMGEYAGGYALVFRLSTDNYHRYCYIDSGYHGINKKIKGVLNTVRPIAVENKKVYEDILNWLIEITE